MFQGYKQEAIYVRSYLLQRAKLLRIYRKKIKHQKSLPTRIYKEFAIPIAIPRHGSDDDMVQTELWRIMEISIRSSDDDSDDINSSDILVDTKLAVNPNYDLSLSCSWISDGFGSTVGVHCVRRVIKDLSTLDRWREFRNAKNRPITDLEKCIKLCNTVDLNVKQSWYFSAQTSVYLKPIMYGLDSIDKFKESTVETNEKVTLESLSKSCFDYCGLFVHYHPKVGNLRSPTFGKPTSNLKAVNEMFADHHRKLCDEKEIEWKVQ